MFKKLLIIIPVLGIIIAASVQGSQAKFAVGQEGQRVVLTTDTGVVFDKSFNEDSFSGMNAFLKDTYNLNGTKNNYVDAAENSKLGFLNNYKAAILKKADALVLPGFPHIDPITDPQASFLDKKSLVLLDGRVEKDNVISIVFSSQLAGLQAGFDAAVWATRKDDQGKLQGDLNGDGKIRIGAFGGVSSKYAVDNFMFGLFLGTELFNLTIGQEESLQVEFANGRNGWTVSDLNPYNSSDPLFFSGSFALGDATKKQIISNLVDNNGADIIFPVAGPQINDVISYRAKPSDGGYRPYIIGIDSDSSIAFPQAGRSGRFINSAIKNSHDAVYQSLAHARTLRQKNNEDGTPGAPNTDIWDGKTDIPLYRNWSHSTVGGLNKVQKHALKLYNDGEETGVITPGQGFDDVLLEIIAFYDNPDLDSPEKYLSGAVISELANQIKDKITPMIDRTALEENVQVFKLENK